MPFVWSRKPTDLDVDLYYDRLILTAWKLGDAMALTLEADAKLNRPWKDQSGAAKAGLMGVALKSRERVTIILAHRVRYGLFLELSRGGRYAILWPTIQKNLPLIMRLFQSILE